MTYDYIIRNGSMIDFQTNRTYIGDLFIKDGKIAKPVPGERANSEGLLDAGGKFVLPGLIDEHAHWNNGLGYLGTNADIVCPNCCITTAVDAGSTGVDNFEAFYKNNIIRYTTDVRAYLHISPQGVISTPTHEEDQNPKDIDEAHIFQLFEKYSHCLRGLKVRISNHTCQYGLEPLKIAVTLADKLNAAGYECHVAVHAANFPADTKIEEILSILRPGDIYTHPFQDQGPTIFNEKGFVLNCMKEAKKRGILFSSGNGGVHWRLSHLKKAFKDHFYPDFISSDIVSYNVYKRPGFNLLYAMNTALLCGMDAIDVLKAVTYTPAVQLGISNEVGTLEPGSRADIAILDLIDLERIFIDRFGDEEKSRQIFIPLMTWKDGKVVFRQIFFDGGQDFSKVLKNYV